ncbi:MAG: hypothetical protein O3B22_13630, partial [Proteobacteria bacterium]|nr:hypothetical protein [Pseudomonadota bacterium]
MAQQSHLVGIAGAVLGGGDAPGGITPLGFVEQVEQARAVEARQDVGVEMEGMLLDDAVGFAATGTAAHDAAGRVLRRCVDPGKPERKAVARGEMGRDMPDENRDVGGDGIEIVARRVAVFGDQGFIVTRADQPAFVEAAAVAMVAQRLLQLADRIDRPGRARLDIGKTKVERGTGEVAVAVDKARQHGQTVEVDDAGGGSGKAHHRLVVAHRQDAPARDGKGAGHGFPRVHGEQVAAAPDALGTPVGGQRQQAGERHAACPAMR